MKLFPSKITLVKSFPTSTALILITLAFLVVAANLPATAQTYTVLNSFDGPNGNNTFAGLVQATDGNFYGTGLNGGKGGGTLFRITPSGVMTTLYSFYETDGRGPWGGMVQADDGNLYGTTAAYGAHGKGGTVFKMTLSGVLTTLHSFCALSNCADGGEPFAVPIEGADGNIYGTTIAGGANPYNNCAINGTAGCGTVFKITRGGKLTTLYTFCSLPNCIDGFYPWSALVQAPSGIFYSTASSGGVYGYGTVFTLTPAGKLTTLHDFDGTDGISPEQPLILANDGNFYGATNSGGAYGGGTVFKITPGGAFTVLYNFCSLSGCSDGQGPRAALVQATNGAFYGTTLYGGNSISSGTIFKITSSGTFTTLYTFCMQSGCLDGALPYAPLIQGTDGNLYSTTAFGGADDAGAIFSFSVGLLPFVETQPSLGKVGRLVNILGTNFTGATSVSFNGTPATFTVVSSSLITTSVPTGATTGLVTVTTPDGTLRSNKRFNVRP